MDFNDILQIIFSPTTAAFALAAIGLNFHYGLTGLLNMGHAGFMLIGMYGYAITVAQGGSIWLGILVSFIGAVVFALLLGWPTLRLRGDYLAIVTIAAAEMVRLVGRSQWLKEWTGGNTGIRGNEFKAPFEDLSPFEPKVIEVGPLSFHGSTWWLIIVGWLAVALAAGLFWRLNKSPWGRVLKGVREDEDAVRSLGKSVYSFKMQALIVGGVLGAAGGVVWAHGNAVQPDSMGRVTTFWIWTMLLLGGAATVLGPILGSVLFWAMFVFIKQLAPLLLPSLPTQQVEPLALAFVGLGLILLIVFRPQGILGDKREVSLDA
jgi:branched-chain amino acid transport system permease protein